MYLAPARGATTCHAQQRPKCSGTPCGCQDNSRTLLWTGEKDMEAIRKMETIAGAVHFFAQRREVVEYRKNDQERSESMKAKKNKRERSPQMQQVSAGLRDVLGMTQWRKEHPHATWAEIEAAVDERMNQLRAQLIQEVVQMGETQEWSQQPEEERPRCATCGKPLSARGEQTRFIQTNGGEAVKLTRTYGTCPECGVGFFPPG